MGFTHILVFDHVLGANPERPGGWKGPYTYRHAFHEPFVLFGFLAAATRRVGLVTGIVILPQRQTALVAKQAAAVDVLSGGRLRLGVGVGWNPVEFEALGEDFSTRGRRIEEQVQVMRALWTRELVTFKGNHHRITDAGLNPLPVQRPIPVWMGGEAEWCSVAWRASPTAGCPDFRPGEPGQPAVDRIHAMVREPAVTRRRSASRAHGVSQIPHEEWGKKWRRGARCAGSRISACTPPGWGREAGAARRDAAPLPRCRRAHLAPPTPRPRRAHGGRWRPPPP